MDIRDKVANFLDDYEVLCIKHGVVMLGADASETQPAEGLKFSSISDVGGVRIGAEVFNAANVFDALRVSFR